MPKVVLLLKFCQNLIGIVILFVFIGQCAWVLQCVWVLYTCIFSVCLQIQGGEPTMITYVSKENNLGPGDKIKYIWGLNGPIFIL